MNARSVASLFLVSSLAVTAGATDLYWCGEGTDKAPAVWNNGNAYWRVDNAGDLVSWNSLSDPRTAYFTSASYFALQGPNPKSIIVDSADFIRYLVGSQSTWGNAWGSLTNFVKRGTAQFDIWDQNNMVTGGSGLANRANAFFDVQGGTFSVSIDSTGESLLSAAKSFLGGSKIRIAQDAVAHLKFQPGMAYETGYQPSIQLDGGTFRMSSWSATNYVNELAFNGGSIVIWDAAPSDAGAKVVSVMGKLSVTGEAARTLSISADNKAWLTFNPGPGKTLVQVDDVTGSTDIDFTIPYPLHLQFANGFAKTGAGTLQLNTSIDPTHVGNIDVREGKLRLFENQNFMDCGEHVFTVNTNATLEIPLRNNISGGYNIYHGKYAKTRYLVFGGNLIVGDTNLWGNCNLGDELLLDNATFVCRLTGAGSGNADLGALTLSRQVTLRGETPYVFAPNDWSKESSAAYNLYPESEGGTIVTVDDISNDLAADATFSVRLRDYYSCTNRSDATSAPDHTMTSGLTKKGVGTLYLANAKNSFTGPVRVDEGTLWTDGPASAAVVASGAYLGGTGTVATATFAADAGLSAKIGQTKPLKVTTAVTLPETGVVDVYNAAETLPERVRIPVLDAPQGLSGATGEWTVRLNGVATTDLVVKKADNQLWVKRNKGLVLMFR